MKIKGFLHKIPHNRAIINSFTVSDVLAKAKFSGQLPQGLKVTLYVKDVFFAFTALTALDGIAAQILLIPPSVSINQLCRSAAQVGTDVILTDFPVEAPQGPFRFVTHLESLLDIEVSKRDQAAPTLTRWMLATSGTTGEIKLVAHSLASLVRTTKTSNLGQEEFRWGLLYEYCRFAGLQVLLQSTLSGSKLVAPDIDATLQEKVNLFTQEKISCLSATPTLWRQILMTPGCKNLPLRQVTLGGEIADDYLLAALRSSYPEARISHVYASTESGVGFSVNDGKAGFPASYLDHPSAPIEITVRNNCLFVRNTDVQPCYVNTQNRFVESDGFVDTGDAVKIQNGRVYFLGRDSGVINVGGNKVHPEEVERVLLQIENVALTRVYPLKNPISGALVAADIQLKSPVENEAEFIRLLQACCRKDLDRYKVPAIIKITNNLAVSLSGKVERTV